MTKRDPFLRELLPVARQSLGSKHELTIDLNLKLAATLSNHPESTRDDLRLNKHDVALTRPVFHLNTGDDLLEAETIMEDVVQRRRRVFGPAHPATRAAEDTLSDVRAKLGHV